MTYLRDQVKQPVQRSKTGEVFLSLSAGSQATETGEIVPGIYGLPAHAHTQTLIHTLTQTHSRTHARTQTHSHTHTHTHPHTHTHTYLNKYQITE